MSTKLVNPIRTGAFWDYWKLGRVSRYKTDVSIIFNHIIFIGAIQKWRLFPRGRVWSNNDKKVTSGWGEGLSQIRTSIMQLFFVNNFKFFHFNCHLLDWKTCNDNDDGNDDNRKQEKYNYTVALCLINDMTQFMQKIREITDD